jgi:hypothetical protein
LKINSGKTANTILQAFKDLLFQYVLSDYEFTNEKNPNLLNNMVTLITKIEFMSDSTRVTFIYDYSKVPDYEKKAGAVESKYPDDIKRLQRIYGMYYMPWPAMMSDGRVVTHDIVKL